jgi:hypothetical protein
MTASSDLKKLENMARSLLASHDNDATRAGAQLALALLDNAKRPQHVALCVDYCGRITASAHPPEVADAPSEPRRRRGRSLVAVEASRPVPVGRRREGPHRRTAEMREAALAVSRLEAAAIFKRKIRGVGALGNIFVHRLRSIAATQARTAATFLQRGHDDAVEGILLELIADHIGETDPFTRVRNAIAPEEVKRLLEIAQARAPLVLRDGMERVATNLIASARIVDYVEAPPSS